MAESGSSLSKESATDPEEVKQTISNGPLTSLNVQMMFYGVACVLFWSVLLIQVPFIKGYFGGTSVLFYIPLVYGLFSNVSRILVLFLHSRSKESTGVKLTHLIFSGASITAGGMCCIPILMGINGTENASLGFWMCLVTVAVVGTFNSLLVTGGFALMSLAPKGSGQFFLLGLTATGIITWPFFMLLRFAVSSLTNAGKVDFVVAAISLCISAALCVGTIPVYKYFTRKHPSLRPQLEQTSSDPTGRGLVKVFRLIWVPAMAMWFARLVTFALYPGMIGIYTPSSGLYSISHYQSFLIYLGPLSDTVGQLVYRYTKLRNMIGMKSLIVMTVVRAVIIFPLFLISAWMDYSDSFIRQDWFRCLMMFGFSFSMGINYSAGNALAPQTVSSSDEKFIVGVILSFVAMNGLFIGSLVGVGLKELF
jgi:hypothetical protein